DFARARDLELLAANDDRRALVDADPEDVGMPGDDFLQIVLTIAGQHVLIDCNAFDQTEAFLVARRHHDVVVLVRPAHHVGPEYRGASRTSAHDAAALEHPLDLTRGPGAQVRVDEVPLATAGKPDRPRGCERADELLRVGYFSVVGVQQCDVGGAEVL